MADSNGRAVLPNKHQTESVTATDSEENDCDTLTMVDFLKEEKQLEDDVKAVLGSSNDDTCTYFKGYMKRQALYACLTCKQSSLSPGGICLACSFSCHENHQLVELYTKRNFRCDCGNSRFPNKCNLAPEKSKENVLNSYNYNFDGNYCTCLRPYPDDSVPDDEMIQCIICEDWYHSKHLGNQEPPANFAEMVCFRCVEKNTFLNYYYHNELTEQQLDIQEHGIRCPLKEPLSTTDNHSKSNSLFMPSEWRQSLCRCVDCNALYASSKVSYLLDPEDSVQSYEDNNLAMASSDAAPSQYEQGLKALSALDHVDQIEVIEGYNNMKDQLLGYLQKFADKKQVVKAEDIHEFFSGMQARKKPKFELPHFCR